MSAMLQPADRSGRITCTSSPVSVSAVSAMKCTPQNTIHFAPRLGASAAAMRLSFSESPIRSACRITSSRW